MRRIRNKGLRIFLRIIFWLTYLFAGLILYTNKIYIFSFTIYFLKLIYPLTIFWLQVRINNREKWIPVDSTMSASQLWLRIIPIIFCLLTSIFVYLNYILFLIDYILI